MEKYWQSGEAYARHFFTRHLWREGDTKFFSGGHDGIPLYWERNNSEGKVGA
jgi:hypothetical protein